MSYWAVGRWERTVNHTSSASGKPIGIRQHDPCTLYPGGSKKMLNVSDFSFTCKLQAVHFLFSLPLRRLDSVYYPNAIWSCLHCCILCIPGWCKPSKKLVKESSDLKVIVGYSPSWHRPQTAKKKTKAIRISPVSLAFCCFSAEPFLSPY